MPRGSKEAYSDKQKRMAEHIEDSVRERGGSEESAERIGWATVNKRTGGAAKKKSGASKSTSASKSKSTTSTRSMAKKSSSAGKKSTSTSAKRSAAAKKGWATRRKSSK